MNAEERHALVLVANDQLSLAIGKEGQNVRLAARLTGWKIDIKDIVLYKAEQEKAAQQTDNSEEDLETEIEEQADLNF